MGFPARNCLSFVLVLMMLLAAGCAENPPAPTPQEPPQKPGSTLRTQRPYQINGIWYYPLPTAEGYVEEGMASWYGPNFHGKATSCGERYDMYAMTAAHKTLPLGTYVKVTNLQNGRNVILRVNDRGPFVSGRIIDLSLKGAQELGSDRKGLCRVRVEAVQVACEQHIGQNTYWKVDPVPNFRYGQFTVQVGAFKEQNNANRLKDRMSKGYNETRVYPANGLFRVQVGNYRDLSIAQKELNNLRSLGFGDAFVVAVEGN